MSTKNNQSWFKRTVIVSAKNIAKALKLYSSENREKECPVALALRGLKLRNVEVNRESAETTVKGKLYRAELPKAAQNFIDKFDKGKASAEKVKPFTVNLKFIQVPVED